LAEVQAKIIMLSAQADQTPSMIRRRNYLLKQREEIQKVLNDIYWGIGQEIKAKAVELAQATPALIHRIIIDALPVAFDVGFSVPKLDTKTVLAWWESSQVEGSFFNDWLSKLEKNSVDRIVAESRRSLVLHEDPVKSAKRLQEALNISRNSAQTLMTTALQEAVNYGEVSYYQENAKRITEVLFVAELDRRTCPLCRGLDLTTYPTAEAAKYKPPLHMSCRCRLFPVFSFGDIYGLEKAKRITRKDTQPRTVHHRDGTTSTAYEGFETELVPFKTDYNSWMNSMVNGSAADQKFALEALGPTRFDLVKSGKLEMNSLYYGGKLRTIKELEALS
jgi:SPP1 gp7 family putative phage head morphogenesis protein